MEKLYQQLGFYLVREKLAEYTLGENANYKALSSISFLSRNIYLKKQELYLEMRDLLALDTPLPLIGFQKQDEVISKTAVKGTVLNEDELWIIADIIKHARQISAYFHQRENKYPELKKLTEIYNPDLKGIEQDIFKLFNSDRQITDNASPELFRLRKKIAKIDQNIRVKVSHIAAQWMEESIASEDVVAFRNGRQVIPIRASRKSKAPGIIHDQSQTGQTVYVEPMVIVEMNNDLYRAKQEERMEVRRILLKASDDIREYLPSIELCIEALESFDLIQAHGRLALSYHLDKPEDKEATLHIVKGRNLELNFTKEPVPLDLDLPQGKCGIIITGPNAGGKTVTLKTIGLLAVMNQAGFLLPTQASSTFPEYDNIFVDIGDGQSINGGLSTFSSHILSLKNIIEQASDKSLVLIDELGTGTDPDEGAALAEGILKILSERGTTIIATTHHGSLKTLAFDSPHFENGSMSFNDKNLEPNYKFILGIPGSSYAIDIAKRYELDNRVILHAKERVGKQREKLERLIVDLQRKISRYDTQLKESKKREKDYKEKLTYINDKKNDIDHKYKKAEKEAIKRAESMIADMRKELELSIKQIREQQASKNSIREAQSTFRQVKEILVEKRSTEPEIAVRALNMKDLKDGMQVYVPTMSQNGTILEINQKTKKIWVDVDGSRLRLQIGWLEPARKIKQRISTMVTHSSDGSGYHLDLRGKRAEEALAETDKFLDNAILSGISTLEILHGTGHGILQKVIHDFLSGDHRIKEYKFAPADRGGVGVTYVKLRE
ncbi:MAG: Smr/MutS family protein [Candidatus Marinimicrobia bacterium]|nr:Smr/MutS family protein [Candidatus Neomarinimicrobiota bacterium]